TVTRGAWHRPAQRVSGRARSVVEPRPAALAPGVAGDPRSMQTRGGLLQATRRRDRRARLVVLVLVAGGGAHALWHRRSGRARAQRARGEPAARSRVDRGRALDARE